MKHYSTYIFDLYGTLVDIHTEESQPILWKQMAEFYTCCGAQYTDLEFKKAYFSEVNDMEMNLVSKTNTSSYEAHPEIDLGLVFEKLFSRKGISVDENTIAETAALFRRISTIHIRNYEGAWELLDALRQSGSKVYLLSNAQRLFTEPELEKLELKERFDDIYLSSDYGCKKPAEAFFRQLIDRHSLEVSECLMIGNDPVCDILGAKNVGMDSYYIHSSISPQPAPPLCGKNSLQATYYQMEMDLRKLKRELLAV